jgi:hypothetical protein
VNAEPATTLDTATDFDTSNEELNDTAKLAELVRYDTGIASDGEEITADTGSVVGRFFI